MLLLLPVQFSLDDTTATLQLGSTRVMSVITAALEAPYPDRPNEVRTLHQMMHRTREP
jgi:exosome complex RNA-binding protein Rrp42 (RNase PH superfamily)